MNFLQICQRMRQEAGISGSGPVTVSNQSGEMKRVVDWCAAAWNDIQLLKENWNWMRGDVQFNTTASKRDYSPADAGIAAEFSKWDPVSFRIYRASVGTSNEFDINFMPWESFRHIYMTGFQVEGTPVCFSISPDQKLMLGPKPDDVYTMTGEYWKKPTELAQDSDTPSMPNQYHLLIVWMALEKYGWYESASEVIQRALKEQRFYKSRLGLNQMPMMQLGEPLA